MASRKTKVIDIEGVGEVYAAKLIEAGIKNTDQMLAQAATPKARKALAEKTGISDALILKWANHSDLMRIKGIGPEYAELLEAAGVDTVKELRKRKAENLAAALRAANETRKLVRVVPSMKLVQGWVDAAKTLEPVMKY